MANVLLLLLVMAAVLGTLAYFTRWVPLKMVLAIALVAPLLGACAVGPDGPRPSVVETAVGVLQVVQATTRQACGYLPAASMVQQLLLQAWPPGDVAVQIAQAVCAIATTKSYRPGVPRRVREVPLEGRWVRN